MTYGAAYHRWNLVHAGVVTAATVVVAAGAVAAAPFLAAWSALALLTLSVVSHRALDGQIGAPLPNVLTATRGAAAVAVFASLPIIVAQGEVSGRMLWLLAAAFAAVEITDFFDGRLARRAAASGGSSVFGATWDMENDALFTLSLSLFHHHIHRVGAFVVAIGLMRYVYVLVWHVDGDPPTVTPAYKRFARTTAATIVVTMIAVVTPIFDSRFRVMALAVVLSMQVVSFAWDLLLQHRARVAA